MYITEPPKLETFDHWPSWLNARGHLDRSACFELKVSDVRWIAGCIPMQRGQYGKLYRARGRKWFGVPDLPNERPAASYKGRISCGHYDLSVVQMDELARRYRPRKIGGDWRTGRAPAMRPVKSNTPGMSLKQGGYGPGSYAYELNQAQAAYDALFAGAEAEPLPPWLEGSMFERPPRGVPLDAGLDGNPNQGACREKRFGLDADWSQRLSLEKWSHNSVSGLQYFLICPGPWYESRGIGCVNAAGMGKTGLRSTVDAKGLKGLTGTTSNCGDGSKGAHGKGWVCGQRVYKLFWVLGRPGEHRDALLAEDWIASLSSGELSRQSAAVSALIDRYGPIMGDDRLLRCRRCLKLRYGQSPEVLRRKRRRRSAGFGV